MHAIPEKNAPKCLAGLTGLEAGAAGTDELVLRQNSRGTIFAASGASRSFFGVASRKLQGLRLTDLVAAQEHSHLLGAMTQAMRKGVSTIDAELRRGAAFPRATIIIHALTGGGFRTVLTPLAQSEPDIPAAHNDDLPAPTPKVDKLADVSHEIRTPLNAVIGFADALRQESFGPLGDRRYRDYAKLIQESGQHVLSLVNDLLDISKAEADRLPISCEETDPRDVVESCAEMMRLEAERAGLTIDCLTSARVQKCWIDAKVLRQIVLNLLSNALKFTDEGGIIIRTRMFENKLVVGVEDTGVGMSKENLERIGERFYQARTEGVRGARGSGLGLALSSALARAHGGRLDIESEAGRGTTATLTLPAPLKPRRYQPIEEISGAAIPVRRGVQAAAR